VTSSIDTRIRSARPLRGITSALSRMLRQPILSNMCSTS
jgi:hypothetical protein